MVTSATQSPLEATRPPTSRSRRRCSPTEAPDGLATTARRSPTRSATTSCTRRRSTARRPPPTSSTRSSARCCPACRTATCRPTWPASRASTRRSRRPRTTRPAALPTSAGSPRRTTRRWRSSSPNTTSIGVIGALTLPVSAPVPEEYAKEYDAENPSTYGEHQVSTGPYMIENDAERRAHRLHAEQGDPPGSQPELGGLGRGLPARVPGRDHDPGGLRRHGLGVEEDPRPAAPRSTATSPTPPSAIKQAATEGEPGQLTLTPSGGNRYIALNTQTAAVRRHQRPQGRDREREPHGPAQHARWRADRTGRDPLSCRRTSPASRKRADSRAPASTSWPTRTAIPSSRPST